jgi:hypothetical protein
MKPSGEEEVFSFFNQTSSDKPLGECRREFFFNLARFGSLAFPIVRRDDLKLFVSRFTGAMSLLTVLHFNCRFGCLFIARTPRSRYLREAG